MKTHFLLVGLLATTTALYAEIFKWTDSNGNVHFSDKAQPGAERVELPPVQVYSPPSETPSNPPPAQQSKPATSTEYTLVEFIQPVDQATVRDNQGNFLVNIAIEPSLDPDDLVQILLDNAPIGKPQNSTSFQLKGVNRGSHRLQAQILSAEGEVLKSSETITIFLHKAIKGRSA